jgi:PAS domain S-box-containing protein
MCTTSVRVLLVEDSLSNARLLQEQLGAISSEPLSVTHVKTLDEALTRLGEEAYDIALLDLSIPGNDGIDAVRRLHSKEPHIPIVGVTGEGMVRTESMREGGAQEFIVENLYDPQAISQAMHYAIRQKRIENALRESEERFRRACDASRAVVYDVDAGTGRATFVQGLSTLLGYDSEEKSQNEEWWLEQIHEDDITEVIKQLRASRARGNDYSLQYRVRHKSGEHIVVEDTGRNILDETGRIIRTIGSVVNITQRKQAEDAMRRSEEHYRELADELEQMVEQRTADLEQRSLQLRATAAELTQAEERERKRLAQAIHDDLQQLLVGARFCAETLAGSVGKDSQEAVQQLNQFLKEAIESTRSLTFELSPPILNNNGLARSLHYLGQQMEIRHGLKVSVRVDEEADLDVEGLKILLFQATRELLFNVVKHAHVKTAEVEMRRLKANLIQITVSDSGAGFDPEQANSSDAQRGFGLFSIRGRLELIGGRLEIKSIPGSGSRFTIMAPLSKSASAKKAAWETTSGAAHRTKPRGGMIRAGRKIRVLVADDHIIMRQGLMRLLQGHKDIKVVGEAADGPEVLELAGRLTPDVIIMEANMPGLNGIQTISRLREEFPRIKVICLSAGDAPGLEAAMCNAGAFAFLNKANRLESLIATIRDCLAGVA